jgi:hypothetical protein
MRRVSALTIFLLGLLAVAACLPGAQTPAAQIPATTEMLGQPAPAQAGATGLPPTTAPEQAAGTPAAPERRLALGKPLPGATITSPVHVHGEVDITPFESTLRGRVYDANGQVLGEAPILLPSEMGQPGIYDGFIEFSATADGAGEVEIAELSPKDGSIVVRASVPVEIRAVPLSGAVEIPARGQRVVLPLRILARVGQPDETMEATLRWQDGTELTQSFVTLRGEDGRGLLIDSLNWPGESQPPEPATQPATLELRDGSGGLLGRQELVVLSPDDPDTQPITLYFLAGEELQAVTRLIPRSTGIATDALKDLLWGPPAPNLGGFGTALPTPQEVLNYAGRGPDWGPRVMLRGLTIDDGIAMADFSKEMQAYGGGSLRVSLLRRQIESTLKQFPTVSQVILAVEGQTEEVLQP